MSSGNGNGSARPKIKRPQIRVSAAASSLPHRQEDFAKSKTDIRDQPRRGRGNPNWRKGVVTNPRGRAKGVPNKFSVQQYKVQLATGRELPLQFMLRLMRDEKKADELRLSAATAAAPYLHRKMPIGIEHLPDRFGSLTPEQLRKLPMPALRGLLVASQAFYHQLVRLGVTVPQGQTIEMEAGGGT